MKRTIGRTGLTFNALGFGAWQLSNVNRPSYTQAVEVIKAALNGGADLIDTADCYCLGPHEFGHNERLVTAVLSELGRRSDITIASKCGMLGPADDWAPAGSPERIRDCCEQSLKRLEVEAITLYQLHTPDPNVPIEDTIGALADMKTAGKILHIGVSNVDLDQLKRALDVTRIESVQNRCNPWARADIDNGLLAYCAQQGITYIPWHPVGGEEGHRACAANPVLLELANKYDVSPYQLLIGWLLALGEHVLPIPGATRISSVVDSLKAIDVKIDTQDLQTIGSLAS